MQSYIPIQRQAELHKVMRIIFDDYYYLSLISAQKSNSFAIFCYKTAYHHSVISHAQSFHLILHHETI